MRSKRSMSPSSAKPASQKPDKAGISKKSYTKPVIKVYGSIETITATVFNTSTQSDGGSGTMNKTH